MGGSPSVQHSLASVIHFSKAICICRKDGTTPKMPPMKIAKPLLLVTTPLGIVTGLIEAYRMVGGLAILMFAMMALCGVAAASVVFTIRKEKRWTESRS
jgi:hypothetical protein